jgi:uncharacterized protein YlxW (UPF0749 family)
MTPMPAPPAPRARAPIDHSPGFDDTESMLGIVMAGVLEDSYERAAAERASAAPVLPRAAHGGARLRSPVTAVVGLALIGLLLTWAVVQTAGQQPEVAAEQAALVKRVQDETTRTDALSARKDDLNATVETLRAGRLPTSGSPQEAALAALGVASGTVGVRGPGVTVTTDDADASAVPGAKADPAGRILDIDLQYLVNGLWVAGAEAVSVNGQRLTSTTSIRGAGQAITVDYRPVARPYVVQAVGDPKTLQARFVESAGGDWMQNLKSTHDIRFDVTAEKSLTIDGDGTSLLRYATPEATP